MADPELDRVVHPEGLTAEQEGLADLLATTPIRAEIRRGLWIDGEWTIVKEMRDTFPIDFAAKEGDFAFKMHDGHPEIPLSPIRVSLRNLPEELLQKIAGEMAKIPDDDPPRFVTGIPAAGVPLAKMYSEITGIEYIDLLEKIDNESERKIISKPGMEGTDEVRIIDDLITMGFSKDEAIAGVQRLGYQIKDLTVLIDYGLGAPERLAKQGLKLRVVFTIPQLMKYYLRTGRIDQTRYKQVITWLSQVRLED